MKFSTGINKYIVTQSTDKNGDNSDDDYVSKCMGAFGCWQALICPITSVVRFLVVWNVMSIVYLTPSTNFACVHFGNNTDINLIQVANSTCYVDCLEYEFFNDVFEETLISKFGLICEEEWLKSFTQTITMFGLVLGVSGLGWFSDRFGRRRAYLLATFVAVSFMIACPFAPTFWIFTALRFFVGIGIGGIMAFSIIVNIEMVGQKYRAVTGALSILPDGIGQVLLSIMAYHSTTWHGLILMYASISVFLFMALFAVPETPRWLVSQRRGDEAIAMMTKVAKFNGLSTDHIRETVEKAIEDVHSEQKVDKKYHFVDLFRSAHLAKITVICFFVWMAAGSCFFGLNHYSTLLGLNIFVVVPLMGLVQIIGPFLALPINKYCGRKTAICSSFCVIGTSMATLVFIPDGHWGCTVTTGIGLMFAIILFGTAYTQSNELFPTPVRNMGVGIISAGSKFGAMIAPFIANTHPHWVASAIFAVIPFVGAAASLLLPETKGKPLKDTVN